MIKGKVKWYNRIKGFGFIVTEDEKDIFVHRSSLENAFKGLKEDQTVVFEIKESEKGLFASNVKIEE